VGALEELIIALVSGLSKLAAYTSQLLLACVPAPPEAEYVLEVRVMPAAVPTPVAPSDGVTIIGVATAGTAAPTSTVQELVETDPETPSSIVAV
jgi:hypothetical protein